MLIAHRWLRLSTFAAAALALACGSSTDSAPGGPTSSSPAAVATVSVNPPAASVVVNATTALAATTKDASGNTLSGRTVTWSSSDQAIASVTSAGVVTGVAAGTATITATSEGKTGTAALTVTPLPVVISAATVSVTLNYGSVMAGQSLDAQAVAKDAAGNALSGRTVAWSSSNATVATVTADGYVSTLAAGSATITATVDGKTGSAPLVVQAPPAPDAGLHVEFSPLVYPASGGKGINVILDGKSGTTDATIVVGSVSRAFTRVPQSNRFVVTLSNAELVPTCAAQAGALPACNDGNVTVITDGVAQTVFDVIAQSPANTAPATITPLSATAQRSAYTVNVRQDDFSPTSTALQFYASFADVFDYLVLHNTARVVGGSVFYVDARNRVTGLGIPVSDNSAQYGASPTGKLRGFVNFTTNAPLDLAEQVMTHEMGHAFCCFIGGTPLSSGSPHWPLSTAAFGIMGGNGNPPSNAGYLKLTPLTNGTFRVDAQAPYSGFTNLDLYLFGLADSSQVEPQVVFANQAQTPAVGAILSGTTTTTTIRDIVLANGLRPLEYTGTPVTYRAALVVVSRGRLLTAQEMAYFDLAAQRGEATSSFDGQYKTPFFVNTRGRGVLVTKLP